MAYQTPNVSILGDKDNMISDIGIAVLYPALMYMMYEHNVVVY